MGNAKRRGTREERIAQSIARREWLEAERLRLVRKFRATNPTGELPEFLWPFEWYSQFPVKGWREVVRSHE